MISRTDRDNQQDRQIIRPVTFFTVSVSYISEEHVHVASYRDYLGHSHICLAVVVCRDQSRAYPFVHLLLLLHYAQRYRTDHN